MFDVNELKNKVLDGYKVTKEDAMNLIDVPLDDLANAANEIRKSFCGNNFDACMLINVKSGRCSENCKFCAQSNHYNADIEIYPLLSYEELKEKSLAIYNSGFKRISYVASGRKVTEKDFETMSKLIEELKEENKDIKICVSLGLLTKDQIVALNEAGVDRIHNNLESSRNYFKEICTTHSYDEKLDTIEMIHDENVMICSGG
ncbi:MAG: radical SAM protein, partial [Methanobrevibacter sp.]|nr:radical SAM protein [Methanobrevibacter sp.]